MQANNASPPVSDNMGFLSRKKAAVGILLLVNLLNYMDRFTIAGVLGRLQDYFTMNDQQAGMLQTVFVVFYMMFAPLCGFLGDRYNRKLIMAVGLVIWILAVFGSTLVGRQNFTAFLFLRGVVGIGEASYSTVAPTIIGDIFSGHERSLMLMIFYFAIPVGSGLGYIGGSYVSLWAGSWQWGVRFTPILGVFCVILLCIFLEEPARGQSEHAELSRTTVMEDLRYLMGIRTYVLSSLGFTCVVFAVGSLSWWTPQLMGYAYALQHSGEIPKSELAQVSLVFGLITCAAGIVGVLTGSSLARAWKEGGWNLKATAFADPLVCAIGALFGMPFLFFTLVIAPYSMNLGWVLMFVAVTSMCLNWAVNMDMLMSVVVANRRATATALQTLVSHALGDASSPYIVGMISDSIRGNDTTTVVKFVALQYALFVPTFLLIVGGGFYLWSTFHVEDDTAEAKNEMHVPLVVDWGNPEDEEDDVQTLVSNVRRGSDEPAEEAES